MQTVCVVLLVLFVLGLGAFVLGYKKRSDAANMANRGAFTIGKTTTFVTGPIEPSGHIDYVAVLNSWLSKEVSPENNSNVAIWKAFGPNPHGGVKVPPGVFERMGMMPPPATGDYFIDLNTYCDRHAPGRIHATCAVLDRLVCRSWTTNESRTLDGWLRANEKPLAVLREAVKPNAVLQPAASRAEGKGARQFAAPRIRGGP